jgi:hypothetical protein
MTNAFGIDDDRYEVSKADRSSGNPSTGRRAAHWAGGGYHTLAVSPKGRKLKNLGRDEGSTALGVAPGLALFGGAAYKGVKTADKINSKGGLATASGKSMRALRTAHGLQAAGLVAAGAGGFAARQHNLTQMNRKGYLKKEEVGKRKQNIPASGQSFSDEEWNEIRNGYVGSQKGMWSKHKAKKHMDNPAVRAGSFKGYQQKDGSWSTQAPGKRTNELIVPVSKSVATGLKMVGQAGKGKGMARLSMTGAKRPTSDLASRMAAGKKAGKVAPRNSLSQTSQIRMKDDPLS